MIALFVDVADIHVCICMYIYESKYVPLSLSVYTYIFIYIRIYMCTYVSRWMKDTQLMGAKLYK